jgi:hypothetical protein
MNYWTPISSATMIALPNTQKRCISVFTFAGVRNANRTPFPASSNLIGNFMGSRHFSEGGYDRIAIKLFQNLNVSTHYLEYDSDRAGGFEPLTHLPAHKNVILGVVTSKFPKLEDKEKTKERILAAANIVAQGVGQTREEALQRLGVSPQCGFASHEEGNLLGWEDMKNKLALVRSIADDIWPGEA